MFHVTQNNTCLMPSPTVHIYKVNDSWDIVGMVTCQSDLYCHTKWLKTGLERNRYSRLQYATPIVIKTNTAHAEQMLLEQNGSALCMRLHHTFIGNPILSITCEQRTYASIQHNIHKNVKKKEPFLRYNSVLFSKPSH